MKFRNPVKFGKDQLFLETLIIIIRGNTIKYSSEKKKKKKKRKKKNDLKLKTFLIKK